MALTMSFICSKKETFFSKNINSKNVLRAIESLANKFEYEFFNKENYFNIKLCPNGIIDMNLVDNQLEGDIETTACGPGFHKKAVEFLDAFAKKMNCFIDVVDDTSYWADRDFKKMQNDHVAWLVNVVTGIAKYTTSKYLVSWNSEVWEPAIESGFISNTMYYRTEEVYDVMNEDLYRFAREFFIWFNEIKDAYFYRGCALYSMWNEFCWVTPRVVSDNEKAEKTLKLLNTAYEKDSNIELPKREYFEIYKLIGEEKELKCNDMSIRYEVGYRKNNIIYYFEEGWKFIVPGFFIDDVNDGIYTFDDSKRAIQISFSNNIEKKKEYQELLEASKEITVNTDNNIIFEQLGYKYIAEIKSYTENLIKKYKLSGKIFSTEKTATINIIWENETEREWAKNLFLTLEGPEI